MRPRLLLVGCGRMGRALLRGWLPLGHYDIFIVNPSPVRLGPPEAPAIHLIPPDFRPEVVVLAIKPQKFAEVVPACRGYAEALFLSVAAGRTLATLEALLGPVAAVRAMPNIAARVGLSATAAVAGPRVSPSQRVLANALLGAVGPLTWLGEESQLDAVTALSGSGPAYVFYLIEALTEAAITLGLPKPIAAELARNMVIGAGQLLREESQSPEALRAEVTSPGGTTQAAMAVLQDGRFGKAVSEALAAAHQRAKELAE